MKMCECPYCAFLHMYTYIQVYVHIYMYLCLYLYLQAGLLDDLRGHMGSSMQLLQQLQSQATKLDQAQAAIAQELRAQRRERGETLRRATLELALPELTHGRVDHVGQSAAQGLTRSLVSACCCCYPCCSYHEHYCFRCHYCHYCYCCFSMLSRNMLSFMSSCPVPKSIYLLCLQQLLLLFHSS